MSNLSDKELDRLSREAAERYQPDEDISSWEKLVQLLDGELPNQPLARPPRSGPSPIFYGALVLLISSATFFIIKSRNNRVDSTLKTEAVQSAKQNVEKANASSQPNATRQPSDLSSAGQKTENAKDANRSAGANVEQNASAHPNAALKNPLGEPGAKNNQSILNSSNSSIIGRADLVSSANGKSKNSPYNSMNRGSKSLPYNSAAAAGIVAASAEANRQPDANLVSSQNKYLTNQTPADLRWATLPGLASGNQSSPNTSGLASKNSSLLLNGANTGLPTPGHNNQSLKIFNPLKIGFMIAPDYSNVKAADNNRLSINVGLTLGYQIANRWSINTGFIYTVKNYAANGKDFHGSKNMWPPSVQLDYVKGSCNMIEVPLNLRYDFSKSKYTTFFATGGLSSYFMKQESYDYYFHTWGSGPYRWPTKQYNSGDQYILSIGTLSLGMETQVGNNVSLQVEPFIKVPFTGVGIGNLQLNSYGISFSLRYAPVLKKSRH